MRKSIVVFIGVALLCIVYSGQASAEQTLNAVKVKAAPTVDGTGNDAAWKSAKAIAVMDRVQKKNITIKSVYTDDSVYFLVKYPDSAEDRFHKPWVWNKEMKVYKIGPQREDTFTLKWLMSGKTTDISNFSESDYTADVWYWKANRTDPLGYSDDKTHVLSGESRKKARNTTSKSGKARYLMRIGDAGTSAQKKQILTKYQGDVQNQYVMRQPDGSRADIKAKGVWKDGYWTVEFGRKLDTGHDDDVSFVATAGKKYLFGVSVYGLYGEDIDRNKPHLYGQGRISEPLYLIFK